MLQYLLTESNRYSAGELAQMAIEGGCMWISIHMPHLSDEDIRAVVVPDVVDMCRDASVFLTVDDRPGLARDLGLHGVRISTAYQAAHSEASAMSLRDELGPEAVIGIETADPSAVPALAAADIDFVTLPVGFTSDERRRFISAIRENGCRIPVVAQGDFTPADAAGALADGCNGVSVSYVITDAADPVAAMQLMIDSLR